MGIKQLDSEINGIKMIKDLGRMYTTPSSKQKRRFAIFECPDCGKSFKANVSDLKAGKIKRCSACKPLAQQTTLKNLDTGTKKCGTCKQVLPLDSFSNNKRNKDGKGYRCRKCDSAARKKYYETNEKGRHHAYIENRNRMLIAKYGITQEEYVQLLKSQKFKCGICKTHLKDMQKQDGSKSGLDKRPKMFAVDHCHKTGKVRGLLCNTCNRALGLLKDNTQVLQNAINYLKHQDN